MAPINPDTRHAKRIAKIGREAVLAEKHADYVKHKAKRKANIYANRLKNKDKWMAYSREYQKKRFAVDPDYWRKKEVKRLYGITMEQFYAMIEAQENKCAICKHAFEERERRCVDHCHATLVVRGVLCDKCNAGIAMFCDDEQLLTTAIMYLKSARAKSA